MSTKMKLDGAIAMSSTEIRAGASNLLLPVADLMHPYANSTQSLSFLCKEFFHEFRTFNLRIRKLVMALFMLL